MGKFFRSTNSGVNYSFEKSGSIIEHFKKVSKYIRSPLVLAGGGSLVYGLIKLYDAFYNNNPEALNDAKDCIWYSLSALLSYFKAFYLTEKFIYELHVPICELLVPIRNLY